MKISKGFLKHIIYGVLNEVRGKLLKFFTIAGSPIKYIKGRKLAKGIKSPESFKKTGYLPVTNETSSLFHLLEGEAKKIAEVSRKVPGVSRYINHLDGASLEADSSLYTVALNEKILSLVAGYFGTAPILHGIRLLESFPKENLDDCAIDKWDRDQLWHRDKYDGKSLRLFVYITDCDEKSGPFMFIDKLKSKKLLFSYYRRSTDRELEAKGFADSIKVVTGKAGASFLVDVRNNVHCGSKCLTKRRLAYTAIYTSYSPWVSPDTIPEKVLSELCSAYTSPLQRYALNEG